MGNQITATAPAQILPLESYFTDLTDYNKPTSLGSTRFLKVARATHTDGTEVVVKVFAKHDPLLQLDTYKTTLMEIYRKLYTTANVLPFQHFWETDKAAYLVRQHIHYSLYDRISTRPFLSTMEKRWIIFQLLKVLEECDMKKLNHGDIKSENVLLTGWNWVMLADFASFKPTLLPDDNPADFSFFFDTSRRRTCYLAPERFCPPDFFQEIGQTSGVQRSRVLTHQMDIFSLGCVIAELFLDGRPLFNLSELLEYCNGDREAFEASMKKINDKLIRRMVRHMTQLNPRERLTALEYLSLYKEDIFPDCFYSFLHDYFKSFCIVAQLTPDQWIQKLYEDIDAIVANVILNNQQRDRDSGYGDALVIVLSAITAHLRMAQFAATKLQALQMMKRIALHITDECILERVVPYVMLLVKDVWASVRAEAIKTVTQCLSVIKHLPSSDFNLFLEYILPAMNYIPSDKDVIVRLSFAECVAELAQTAHRFLELAQLRTNQEDDSTFFQFQVQGSYDSELMQLQESIQGKIVHLLSDTESSVKKAFLKHSAGKLCVFFGPQRAKEVILSHMITFLNDKSDWELHKAFFECIVSVATLLRHHSLPILEPLLHQGLCSGEEMVVCKTIDAMTTLCAENLFDRQTLFENISTLAPFLVYPNRWLIYGAVGFLIAASKQLDNVDNECFLHPLVAPFLQYPIIQLQDQCVFLSALKDPVPRGVLDTILKQQNLTEIFDCLMDRENTRNSEENPNYSNIEGHLIPIFKKIQILGLNEDHENSLLALKGHILKQHSSKQQYSEVDSHYSNTRGVVNIKSLPGIVVPRSRELTSKSHHALSTTSSTTSSKKKGANQKTGSTGSDKSQVIDDWDRIFGEPSRTSHPSKELSGTSSSSSSKSKKPPSSPESRKRAEGASDPLPPPPPRSPAKSQGEQGHSFFKIGRKSLKPDETNSSLDVSRSSESIVTTSPKKGRAKSKSPSRKLTGHTRSHSEGAIAKLSIGKKKSVNDAVPPTPDTPGDRAREGSLVKVEYAKCKENLKELLEHKQKQYEDDMRFVNLDLTRNAAFQTSPGWVPKGQLIAHIHDHKDAINRIRVVPDTPLFVSFSSDGCTKLWDVSRIEAKTVANKPKMTYSHQGGKIKTGSLCQANRSIAAASSNGSIQIFNIETRKVGPGNSKRQLVLDTTVEPEYGTVTDMATFSAGGDELVCYTTSMGKLCGLDLRSNRPVWDLTNSAKFGLIMSMAVDPYENWVALGTSLGYHVIWDMRFQLPIRHWQHAGHGKFNIHHVHRLSPHPTQPSSLISAVSYNNEISVWDMETASRRQMLWASPAPAFGEMTSNPRQQDTVRSLSTCIIDNCPVILAGGTDRTIRLWNLVDPSQCTSVVRPKLHSKRINSDYTSKITEGVDVFMEVFSVGSTSTIPGQIGSPDNAAGQAESAHSHVHVDFITDLAVVPYKQHQFIVSASQDGVIKYWK